MEKIIATMFLYKRKKLMQALIGYSILIRITGQNIGKDH